MRTQFRSAGLGILMLGGLIAVPAVADTKDAKIGDAISVTNSTAAEATAICPAGERAVGGGIVPGDSPEGVTFRYSAPTDATGDAFASDTGDVPKRWTARVTINPASSQTFKIFAVCANSDVELVTRDFVIETSIETKAARCPSGARAVGGGAFIEGGYLIASGPTDGNGTYAETTTGDAPRRWLATLRNQLGQPNEARVFAVCSKSSQAEVKAKVANHPGSGVTDASVRCPDGKRALGGGMLHDQGDNIFLAAQPMGPLDASNEITGTVPGDTPKIFYGGLKGAGVSAELKVLAVCE